MAALFTIFLRSVAVPYVAFLFLKDTPLGEEGALLAISIALTLTNVILVIWNILKILPNLLLLRGGKVFILIVRIAIQLGAILFSWFYYISNYA